MDEWRRQKQNELLARQAAEKEFVGAAIVAEAERTEFGSVLTFVAKRLIDNTEGVTPHIHTYNNTISLFLYGEPLATLTVKEVVSVQ